MSTEYKPPKLENLIDRNITPTRILGKRGLAFHLQSIGIPCTVAKINKLEARNKRLRVVLQGRWHVYEADDIREYARALGVANIDANIEEANREDKPKKPDTLVDPFRFMPPIYVGLTFNTSMARHATVIGGNGTYVSDRKVVAAGWIGELCDLPWSIYRYTRAIQCESSVAKDPQVRVAWARRQKGEPPTMLACYEYVDSKYKLAMIPPVVMGERGPSRPESVKAIIPFNHPNRCEVARAVLDQSRARWFVVWRDAFRVEAGTLQPKPETVSQRQILKNFGHNRA